MKDNEAMLPAGRLRWVESLSRLLDDKFRIPGTNFRFGLDPLLNLIPIAGDLSGFLISAALVATMAKHGVSRKVVILMSLNILLDATIGAIPLVGQIFDFVYKANTKNIKLLKEHYEEGRHQGSGTGIVILVVTVFAVFFFLLMYGIWKLADWLWGML